VKTFVASDSRYRSTMPSMNPPGDSIKTALEP